MCRALFCLLVLLSSCFVFSQKNFNSENIKHLDSAYYYSFSSAKLSQAYLDSIPKPIEKSIAGQLSRYYQIKGIMSDTDGDQARLYQNYLLALQYAEAEINYDIAGMVSLELFKNVYWLNKDSLAYDYLEKSKHYYEKINDKYGLIDVMQMPAYVKLINLDFKGCKKEVVKHLDYYKSIEEDAYYYLFALHMLTSSELHLMQYKEAAKHFKEFLSLKTNPNINEENFLGYKVRLLICQSEAHLERKQIDSVNYYLDQAIKDKNYMSDTDFKDYYNLRISVSKLYQDFDETKRYLDSLQVYEESELNTISAASFDINQAIIESNNNTIIQTKKKELNRWVIILLLVTLSVLLILFVKNYKVLTSRIANYSNKLQDSNYLKGQNKKLAVKNQSMEMYLKEIKASLKKISTITDTREQQIKIKALYKDLHINATQVINDETSHLELISQINIDLSIKLKKNYPDLTEQDILTCHYVYSGFKNKEIAVFLNTTIRSIEGRRYRISKKMKIDKTQINLQEFLLSL